MPKLSPWQTHVVKWSGCTACPLCTTRKKVVLARGKIPAEVLFVGEGPGDSEDVLGIPFIGPAGKLLDELTIEAWSMAGDKNGYYRCCWTNLVACFPKAPNPKRKTQEPLPAEIAACAPRLEELITMVRPRLIIAVGKLPAKEGERKDLFKKPWSQRAKVVEIMHPAALLRLDISQQGLQIQRVIVQLTDAFATLLELGPVVSPGGISEPTPAPGILEILN